ncbi:MAG: hypothetical protein AAF635_11525 [Cyanobacteria bacterium P01_C01_bin.69]
MLKKLFKRWIKIYSHPYSFLSPLAGSNDIFEILVVGDSITRGEDAQTPKAQQNGFRDDLAGKLSNAGIRFDFVSSQNNVDRVHKRDKGRIKKLDRVLLKGLLSHCQQQRKKSSSATT